MPRQLTVVEKERLLKLAKSLHVESKTVTLPPIEVVGRAGHLPLSFAQQRLWFLAQQMEGASQAYHISFGWRLKGRLDREALRRALDRIVARHEGLRTTFVSIEGESVQRIAAPEESRFHLLEHDLSGVSDAGAKLDRLVLGENATGFDLERGPLIRGRLVRIEEEEHALLIAMHHIVSDGWSIGVLVRELSALYGAFVRGEEDPLPELDVQYVDYAVWQRKWMEGEILRRQGEYWERTLAGAPSLLELPMDHPRPAEQKYTGGWVTVTLEEELGRGLKELSKKHGATPYMTLLAGWAALLARLSGQEDVVIGTPVANRNQVEIEGLIGFFVNALALRVDVSGAPTVGELLERVKRRVIAAQQHQDIPFEQVVELARPARSLSHSPVFQVVFAWQNAPKGAIDLPGLQLSPAPVAPHAVSKFDLTLSLEEAGEKIVGGVEYATALFERATVERYLGYFRTLLQAMASDDTQEVGRLDILPERERRQVLYEWNSTDAEYPREKCVHELFEDQAHKTPDAVALAFENEFLSYAELNRRANRLAHYLRELGVRPDERVAICVERGLEMVTGLLAILKAGGAYVPLDPAYPAERLRFMLADSAPVTLLTQRHLADLFGEPQKPLPTLHLTDAIPPWSHYPETNLDRNGLAPEHLAYVIYTSGSTGRPKGVMVEHRGVVNYVNWAVEAYRVRDGHGAPLNISLAFDAAVTGFLLPLMTGRCVLLLPEGDVIEALGRALREYSEFSLVKITPAHLDLLSQTMSDKQPNNCSTTFVIGGESLHPRNVGFWLKHAPDIRLINEYGPTETVVGCCAHFLQAGCDVSHDMSIPIGKPIGNTRIYILDSRGEPAPVGVVGELYIGGAGVARGYLNRPDLTAERFLKDPFVADADARMYKTGDLGRWLPDGAIEFLGRNDYQVKIRGFRIEPGEIEAHLLEHESVREVAVIAREDTPGDKRLVAYYTTTEQAEGGVGAEALRTRLLAKLPEHMAPAAYVRLESLPLTPNGKLDRKALPAPEADAYSLQRYEAPQGEVETLLAEMWAKLLKLERVGRHDNFFELGGHSLFVQRVVNLLAKRGIRIPAVDLFKYPTPKLLADRIESCGERNSSDVAICVRKGGPESPLFLTHEGTGSSFYVGALSQYLDPDLPVYGLPAQSAGESQLRTMEALAMRMVRMIRANRPRGPYRIAGYSFGGLIAYEIAAQLIGAGEEVEFLGLLDTRYPSLRWKVELERVAFDDKKSFLRTIEQARLDTLDPGTGEERRLAFTELASKSETMEFDSLFAEAQRMSLLPQRWVDLTATQMRQALLCSYSFGIAALRYSAKGVPIPVHLFLSEQSRGAEPFLGWNECLPEGQIRQIPVTGTHISMMMQPNVVELGQALSTAIRNVSKEAAIRH